MYVAKSDLFRRFGSYGIFFVSKRHKRHGFRIDY